MEGSRLITEAGTVYQNARTFIAVFTTAQERTEIIKQDATDI
jgi:hypothetical protein